MAQLYRLRNSKYHVWRWLQHNKKLQNIFFALTGIIIVGISALIAVTSGLSYAHLMLIVLGVVTVIAVAAPIIIPVFVIIVSPLLGQTAKSTLGPLNAIGILSLWLLAFGAIITLPRLGRVLKQKLIVVHILLVLSTVLSLVVSVNKGATVAEILRVSSAMMMLPLVFLLGKSSRNRKILVASILISAVLPLSVGFYQHFTGNLNIGGARLTNFERESGLIRIYATFFDVHPFAKYLLIVLSVIFSLEVIEKGPLLVRAIRLFLFVLSFVALILTYARGQLISFILSCVVILLAAKKLNLKIVILLIPFFLGLFATLGVFTRFSDLTLTPRLESAGAPRNSLERRLLIWKEGFTSAMRRPVLGHGADTFESAIGIIAHNDYLGLFYDLGIGGPLFYVFFLGMATYSTWRCSRSANLRRFDYAIVVATFGITVAIATGSLAENFFRSTIMWWLYMALLGCTLNVCYTGNPH